MYLMSVKKPVEREVVKLPARNPTTDPLRKKAPDGPLDERVWRVPPRKPTTIPARKNP